MQALQCSKPLTVETVVCSVNLKYGGMTYATHQQCSLMLWTLLYVRIPVMLVNWWGLLPQLKSESAPLHDSKSIAITQDGHSYNQQLILLHMDIINACKSSGTTLSIVQHVFPQYSRSS